MCHTHDIRIIRQERIAGLECFQREAGELFAADKLKHKETVVEGIENAADAFLGLFRGTNIGKMVVKLGA